MARLIPDEVTRNLLLDCVAEIYLSFEECDELDSSIYSVPEGERVMMTSSTIDIFIPEVRKLWCCALLLSYYLMRQLHDG